MEKLPNSIGRLLYSLRSLTVQVKELEKKKLVVSHALSNKDNARSIETSLFEMEGLPDSLEGLQGLLGSLTVQVEEMEQNKKVVLHALLNKDNAISKKKPTVQDIIIVFVEEIEKAHQYYEFLLFLKRHNLVKSDDDALEILKYLVHEQRVHEHPQFNKLDFKQILDAIEVCIWDEMQGNTSSEAFPETENDWYSLISPKVQEKKVGGLENPILSLVYYIREKGHVMDENPLVELSYILKFDDVFYKICFVCRLIWKLSEKEVLVPFLPLNFAEDKVKAELSFCGKIVSFRIESQGPGCSTKTAYVTFENSVAAKIAPLLMRRKSRLSRLFIEPALEEYEYQPKDITEYNKALIMYKEFRNYSKKMSN